MYRTISGKKRVLIVKNVNTQTVNINDPSNNDYASPGHTVTKECYIEVLRRLRGAVRRKRPEVWASGDRHLHQDNAPAHSSALVQTFF